MYARVLAAIAATVTAVVLAACTAHTGQPSNFSSPAPTGSSARYLPLGHCPVTRAVSATRPPDSLHYQPPPPVPYVHGWYGNQVIWVMLPIRGRLPAQTNPAPRSRERLFTKFPWYATRSGQLRVTAQRLDGAGRFQAQLGSTAQGYGPPGFVPSGLYWSSPGCWRLTAKLAGSSLRFTVGCLASNKPACFVALHKSGRSIGGMMAALGAPCGCGAEGLAEGAA